MQLPRPASEFASRVSHNEMGLQPHKICISICEAFNQLCYDVGAALCYWGNLWIFVTEQLPKLTTLIWLIWSNLEIPPLTLLYIFLRTTFLFSCLYALISCVNKLEDNQFVESHLFETLYFYYHRILHSIFTGTE